MNLHYHLTAYISTAMLICTSFMPLYAQFQRQYGTALDEVFTKVIPSGANYYVLGQGEITDGQPARATVSRLNAAGQLQWTLSLNIASVWNDAVLTPSGNLMVVGNSLPDDNTSRGIMGLVTAAGAFTWVRSYDLPQRDGFWRIVRNAAPQSGAFAYYVLGSQTDIATSNTDMFLLNLNENGTLNWKKLYSGPIFFNGSKIPRDMEALPNGDLFIAANFDTQGVIMRTNNLGQPFNGVTPEGGFVFKDISLDAGDILYAVGTGLQNSQHYVMKFDADLLGIWDVIWEGATEVRQIIAADSTGGRKVGGRKVREACARLFDAGGSGPILTSVKFLDNGFATTTPGAFAMNASGQLVFVDGRTPVSGGFGQLCAFISVSGPDLDPCFTSDDAGTISPGNLIYSGPLLPDADFFDVPPSTNLTGSLATWQQAEACATCEADFSFQFPNCDPTVSFTNLSTGSGSLTYLWNFGYSASGTPQTSVAANPVHTFPAVCASYNVCLTVTGNGCTDVVCKTITIKYPQTPVLTCPPNITVACNTNLSPAVTGFATLTGACSGVAPTITFSDVVTGNMPCDATVTRIWTAMDDCGVMRTCVQTIIVRDNVPPVIMCPPNVQLTCSGPTSPAATGFASATDNCSIPLVAFSDVVTGSAPCNQLIVRTWRATDDCGNTATCVQTISVMDNLPPTINCPPTIAVAALAPDCDIPVHNIQSLGATDNCGTPSVSYTITGATTASGTGDASGNIFSTGASTVTYTATDACNNTASCSFNVFVECDTCACLGFSGLEFYNFLGLPDIAVECDTTPVNLPCIGRDALYWFQWQLLCSDPLCVQSVSYSIVSTSGGPPLLSGTIAPGNPHFIAFAYAQLAGPGSYQIILTGSCNGVECVCVVNFTLPDCCAPCEEIQVIARPITTDEDMCCFAIDINNPCQTPYFGKVEIEGLTPGIAWGSTAILPGWSYGNSTSQNVISLEHNSSFVPSGLTQDVLQFCVVSGGDSLGCWKEISAGGNPTTAGIKNDGSLWAWGRNTFGQVGDGTSIHRNIPVRIGNDNDWEEIATGSLHTVALKNDGSLWAWGWNSYGQLGDGTNTSKNIPTRIGNDNDWRAISAGAQHVIALKNDGSLWAWGWNSYGQLGDGTFANKKAPVRIGNDNDWQSISSGWVFNFALKNDGSIWAWGHNGTGELGDGTTLPKNAPIRIGSDNDWQQIVLGGYHTLALKNDGSLWAWGWNKHGQLGDGTSTNRNTPTRTGIDNDWRKISTHGDHSTALKNNGTLWAWGWNADGQIGNGGNADVKTPSQIGSDNDWLKISAGGYHTAVLKNDGSLWTWGRNNYGALGDGTFISKNTPTAISCPIEPFCQGQTQAIPITFIVKFYAADDMTVACDSLLSLTCCPGTCSCGTFFDITYRPFQGAPNFPAICGDTLIAQCNGAIPWTLGGNMLCVGNSCLDNTSMSWVLTGPTGSSTAGSMAAGPGFGITIPPSAFSVSGYYHLTLSAICGMDTCYCEFVIRVDCAESCCADFEAFSQRVENAVSIAVDNDLCKATITLNSLPSCDLIQWIDWGDGAQDAGLTSGGMAMHTYAGSGTYFICYLALEMNETGTFCFEKTQCDTINISCAGCQCDGFSRLYMRNTPGNLNLPVLCDGPPVALPCYPGQGYQLTGVFGSNEEDCQPEYEILWRLTGPGGTYSGFIAQSDLFFGIYLRPAWFNQPGLYTLALDGFCDGRISSCILEFEVDCPHLCPCELPDIQTLSTATGQGFSVVKYPSSCKACFAPVALSDCEEVAWHLNNVNGPVIGNSMGSEGICHTFNAPGTYTVVMVVTRKRSDGTDCATFVKSQTVTITCLVLTDCTDSVFPNATFAQGAVSGGMLSGGATDGWRPLAGEPIVVEGAQSSTDGWSILLSGNFDTSAVLGTLDSACVARELAILSMRAKPTGPTGQFRSMPCDVLSGSWSSPVFHRWQVPFSLLDSSEWVDIEITVNLNDLTGFNPCDLVDNGVWIRPTLTVSNGISEVQGGEDTRSFLLLDQVCINNMPLTPVKNTLGSLPLRLYPNPTSHTFTLELPEPAAPGTSLRIAGLNGQTLLQQRAEAGSRLQVFDLSGLPAGMYFVQVWQEGRIAGVGRVVKQ